MAPLILVHPAEKLQAWLDEGIRLFGREFHDWAFKCPACGTIQRPSDFLAVDKPPELAAQHCIGAYDWTSDACGFLAGGLPLNNERRVTLPSGRTILVFPFQQER